MAPDGYKAVGMAVTTSKDKPPIDEVACVRADLADACEDEDSVWNSDKDGFRAITLRPAVRGIDARGVRAGTFGVHAQSSTAPTTLACLKNNNGAYTLCMPDLAQVHAILAAYSPQVYPAP
jgi:hypothetical protein